MSPKWLCDYFVDQIFLSLKQQDSMPQVDPPKVTENSYKCFETLPRLSRICHLTGCGFLHKKDFGLSSVTQNVVL